MNTVEYLDACKAKLGIESDYKLAQSLELTRSAMSAYRNSGVTFSRATAKKVAKILGIHPLRVVADMERQRAKTPEEQAMWRDFAGKLAAVVAALGVAAIATYPAEVVAAVLSRACILCEIARRCRRRLVVVLAAASLPSAAAFF